MAGCANETESEININLNGIMSSDVKALVVDQFLKVIMYQRQQITATYENLKTSVQLNSVGDKKAIYSRCNNETKKKIDFLTSVDQLTANLKDVFEQGLVKEVVILLGATPVSAKELYRISFPCAYYEGSMLSVKQCTSPLFRELITNELLTDVKPSPTTKLHMYIFAPRDRYVNPGVLIPKLNLKIPERCKQLKVNFQFTAVEANPELSKLDEDLDISGVEPLIHTPDINKKYFFETPGSKTIYSNQSSVKRSNVGLKSWYYRQRTPSTSSVEDCLKQTSSNNERNSDEELIWYQVLTNVAGFKEKIAPATSDKLFTF